MYDICSDCEIRISGNFPETAWRAMHSRQAAHANYVCLGGFWGQRLAVEPRTARRRKGMREFWVIFMNCLAVMNFHQATRVC